MRIKVFYWKRGFREAQVDTVVADRGATRLPSLSTLSKGRRLRIGTRRRAGSAGTERSGDHPQSCSRQRDTAQSAAARYYRRSPAPESVGKGYADALVDTVITLDSTARPRQLNCMSTPKWKATIGEILIEGEENVSERTLRKSLTMTPGDLFRRAEVLKSQRALYESNLFRRAAIEVPKQGDSSKIIVVTVQKRRCAKRG